jgi:O-antigen/teichoic acid export membrane protein
MTTTRRLAFDAALMTGGRIGFVALWFVGVALVYRGLGADAGGVAEAGLFAMSIAVIKVVSGCITDPVDLALMRRVPGLLHSEPEAAYRLLRAAFGLRAFCALLIAGVMYGFGPELAELLFHRSDAAPLLTAVAAGILGDMVLRAILIVLQAGQRFVAFVALEGALQVMRFAAVLVLWATETMSVEMAIGSYAAASAIAAAGGLLLLPRGLLSGIGAGWGEARELLHYLKWMMPGMMVAALNERFDLFLVNEWTGPEAAGLYGAMLTLALVPDLVSGCLSSVLQPRIVQMMQSGRFRAVLRMFLMIGVPVCICGMLVAVPLAAPVIGLVLGPAYLPGVPAFLWVLAGTMFWLAVAPLPLTLLAVAVPSRMFLMTLFQSAILLALGLVLLPLLGLVGMAQTVFVVRVAVALTALVAALRLAPGPRADGGETQLLGGRAA